MNRKTTFLFAAGAAVFAIIVSLCKFPIRSTMESENPAKLVDSANPSDLASLTNGAHSAAALQSAIRTSQSSGSGFEAAQPSPILPLSTDEAVDLVFSGIGLAPNLKDPWTKTGRYGKLITVSILRYVHRDGSVGSEAPEYVDIWVDPETGTVVDPPGAEPAPMDDRMIIEQARMADPWFAHMMESHPVQSVHKIPGIAIVELKPDPRPAVKQGETLLDGPGAFSARILLDTRTGTIIIGETGGR